MAIDVLLLNAKLVIIRTRLSEPPSDTCTREDIGDSTGAATARGASKANRT